MRVLRSSDSILIELTPEENEVVDWIYTQGSTKLRDYFADYLKSRKVNMEAVKDRDTLQGIKSMDPSDRSALMLDITTNRKDK